MINVVHTFQTYTQNDSSWFSNQTKCLVKRPMKYFKDRRTSYTRNISQKQSR